MEDEQNTAKQKQDQRGDQGRNKKNTVKLMTMKI